MKGFWKTLVIVMFVVSGCARGKLTTREVHYRHGEEELVGYLAYDDAVQGKRPGVLVVHEWWGLNEYARRRARMLADLGYVAFACDMYGANKVTDDPSKAGSWAGHLRGDVQLWRSRSLRGLQILRQQPQTDQARLAAIGYCFGGSTVLHMAYADAPVSAVVSFHGGMPVPEGESEIDPAILICHGAQDTHASTDSIVKLQGRLDELDADWLMVTYGHAEHSFTNPAADEHGVDGVSYDENADRRSWQHMQLFLEAELGRE